MNNKVIAYIRVSSQEQSNTGYSLKAQEEKIKAYCLLNGLEIVKIFKEEGISAGKPLAKRPEGKKMLKMLSSKQVDHIVALKLDRLFRNTVDALNLTKEWDKKNIALHLVDMGGQSLNTSTAIGKMFLTMMAGFAEFERGLISERTATVLRHKKANKQVYTGKPALGFDVKNGMLIKNDDEQYTISLIKQWRSEGFTLYAIAQRLTKQGIPTKRGGKWYCSTVKYILDNDLYKIA